MSKKPLLKWAGGKRWLLPTLKQLWDKNSKRRLHLRLVEPFTGGMAVALGLNPEDALLNDLNSHLINFYIQVSRGLKVDFSLKNDKGFYYQARHRFNELIQTDAYRNKEAACLFYFLIRTGYNGLCRFNREGNFNVPFGQHANIQYATDFLEYRETLQRWQFKNQDFEKLSLQGNEFIYADPPYDAAFTKYHGESFTWEDQCRLAEWLRRHRGPVVASNHATTRVCRLYRQLGFTIKKIQAPRRISCTGNREPVQEMLAFR